MARSCVDAVAFFVFFAGAAGTGVVAADFGAGAHRFGRLGLRGAGLILQILLVALLFTFQLSRDIGQALVGDRLAGARNCGARNDRFLG